MHFSSHASIPHIPPYTLSSIPFRSLVFRLLLSLEFSAETSAVSVQPTSSLTQHISYSSSSPSSTPIVRPSSPPPAAPPYGGTPCHTSPAPCTARWHVYVHVLASPRLLCGFQRLSHPRRSTPRPYGHLAAANVLVRRSQRRGWHISPTNGHRSGRDHRDAPKPRAEHHQQVLHNHRAQAFVRQSRQHRRLCCS